MIEQWKKSFPDSYFQTFADDGATGETVCKPLREVKGSEARELNAKGAGIFFTPNGFSSFTKRSEKNCDLLRWWFVDIEGYPKEEQQKRIKEFKLTPSMIIETKNGYHCYWRIKGPSPYWYKVIDGLIEFFGSDMAISSTNEVLRIPTFFHQKDPKNKFEIKLLSQNATEYNEDSMCEAIGGKKVSIQLLDQCEAYTDDIEEIRQIPIRSVLDRLGVQHERNVIFENGKPTSAIIHPKKNYIHRFSGKPGSGTAIDAVIAWGRGKDIPGAIEWLRTEYGIRRRVLKQKSKNPIETEMFIDGGRMVHNVMNRIENMNEDDVIKYHVPILNNILKGIYPTDLITIGADTGAGKSQFIGDLAYSACEQDKRVAYFDLENDEGDLILRQVAKLLSVQTGKIISVNKLRTKEIFEDDLLGDKAMAVFERVHNNIDGNMMFYKNEKIPSLEDFLKCIEVLRNGKGCDLIILDHLHYFEMNDKDVQAIHLGKIMRELRQLTKSGIPVVVASHLKQRQNKGDPTNYDLFGSSNIAKESGVVILFSRNDERTIMQLTKNRSGGGILSKWEGVFDPVTRCIDFQTGF